MKDATTINRVNCILEMGVFLEQIKLDMENLSTTTTTNEEVVDLSSIDLLNLNLNNQRIQLLKTKTDEAALKVRLIRDRFPNLAYCIVAMYDRYILDLLENKSDFDQLSLEYLFFRTRNAGTKFFDDIQNTLLHESDLEMLECYLIALNFAFNSQNTKKDLSKIKTDLFRKIYNKSPNETIDPDLFGCAKMNSVLQFEQSRDNYYESITALLFLCLTLISFFAWTDSTKNLRKTLDAAYTEAKNAF